jgi:hypothetical protein
MNNYKFSINHYPLNILLEQLRSVEEILGEIDALNDELKALEEGLTL